MADTPYAIPHQRPLSMEERDLLGFLLEREAPVRLSEIDALHVVARCGCGRCPTVMFDSTSSTPFTEIANYIGRDNQGTLVGVALLERNGKLSELEAWSPTGIDVHIWPELSTLERANEST
jgi:hypothetical protein